MNKAKKFFLTFWICFWSFPFTIVGAIVSLFLIITGHRPIKWGPTIRFEAAGEDWGGLELGGCFFMTDTNTTYHVKCHETGHLLQQAYFGPLTWFLITIPSIIRYWLREMKSQKAKIIYSTVLISLSLLVSGILLALSVIFSLIPLLIISLILILYILIIASWLYFIEIPKYETGRPYVDYDDIWFEGDATRRGTQFMKKYYPDIKK